MRWTTITIILLLAGFLFLLISNFLLKNRIAAIEKELTPVKAEVKNEDSETEHYELAIVMGRLQLYMNKLWFSAKGKHWELAEFYMEEIDETVEALVEDNPLEDGIEIGNLAKTWLAKNLNPIETAIESKDAKAFRLQYKNVIINCNGCHVAAKHPFIKIKIPETPAFDNQIYSLQ